MEKTGGKLVCKYYNTLALGDCVKGRIDRLSAAPTRREDIGMCLKSFIYQRPFTIASLVSMVWKVQ